MGRDPSEIQIVTVTKNRPIEAIREVLAAGLRDVGENKVQELLPKYQAIGEAATWHFVGHLQRNKVKSIVPFVTLIHSVDGRALAEEVANRASQLDKVQDVLVEVNASEEESKYGVSPEAAEELALYVDSLSNLRLRGLMTMAPLTEDQNIVRPVFATLKRLFDTLRDKMEKAAFDTLSMGMSSDFEVAIQEGSNMIRIGTAIFEGWKE